MRRGIVCMLTVASLAGFCVNETDAQWPNENHYLVYEVPEAWTYAAPIFLVDQFDSLWTTFVEMDKFATPVEKNDEAMVDSTLHQTWWLIDDPVPPCHEKLIGIDNQFGRQDWLVGDGRYLVLPAMKNYPVPPPPHNHYKCYEVVSGEPLHIPVLLRDQFRIYNMIVVEPVLFCNPCLKEVGGITYPIEDYEAHLAVYRLDPPMTAGFTATAFDQFGDWHVTLHEPIWLCVPTLKLEVIGTERSTWGRVKNLYR